MKITKIIICNILLLSLISCGEDVVDEITDDSATSNCTSEYEGPSSFASQQRDAFCELAFIYLCVEGLPADNETVVEVCNTYNNDAFWGTSSHPNCQYCDGGTSGGDGGVLGEHFGKKVMFFSQNNWDYPLSFNEEGIVTIYGSPNKSDIPFVNDVFNTHFVLDQAGNSGDLTFKFKTIVPDPEYAFNGITHEKEMSFSAVHLESDENYIEIEDNNFKVWTASEIESFKENLPIVKFTLPKTEIIAGELIQIENNSNIDVVWRWEMELDNGVTITDEEFTSPIKTYDRTRYVPNGIFYMRNLTWTGYSLLNEAFASESELAAFLNPAITSIFSGTLTLTAEGVAFNTQEFNYTKTIKVNPITSSDYWQFTDDRNSAQYSAINLGGIDWMYSPLFLGDYPYILDPEYGYPYYDLNYLISNNLLDQICPSGWRLPTEGELGILSGYAETLEDFYNLIPLFPFSYFYSNLNEWTQQDNFLGTYFNNEGEPHMIRWYENGVFQNGVSGTQYMPCTCVKDQ